MLKTVVKSSVRILACVVGVALLTGTGCINSLMFHPEFCRGGYGESTEGYVDIGTNVVRNGRSLRGLSSIGNVKSGTMPKMFLDRINKINRIKKGAEA